jgi:predicted  nucleic acid-binding Zn-ribbon protein
MKPTPKPTPTSIDVKVTLDAVTLQFLMQLMGNIQKGLDDIKTQGEQIMSQLDDLNTAIQAEDVEVQDILASVTKVDADIDALIAKIAAGGVPADLTQQLQAIAAHTASLTTAATQLKADDAKSNA